MAFGPTRGFGRIHICISVHLFSCIAWLRLVHSVDIVHSNLLSVSRRVSVKYNLTRKNTKIQFVPVTERVKGCGL